MSAEASAVVLERVFLVPHALDRYREHYPIADALEMLDDIDDGVEVDVGLVIALTQRAEPREPSRYFAGRERRGIFVLRPSRSPDSLYRWTCITYLRMNDAQRKFLVGL